MTPIIGPGRRLPYPRGMEPSSHPSALLSGLLREHHLLEDCIRTMRITPPRILEAGRTLLAFAEQEDRALSVLARWLDPIVLEEMSAEHDEIGRDLELLEWLVRTTPESPDAMILAESLARRMHKHVTRDGRLLARAAGLLDQSH